MLMFEVKNYLGKCWISKPKGGKITGPNKIMNFIIYLSCIFLFVFSPVAAHAQSSQSSNYKIDENFIGPGGLIDSSSPSYSGSESVGDTSVGDASSNNFKSKSGYTTTDDPRLVFEVSTSNVNFGALSSSTAVTATSDFSVINETSYGYIVQTVGSPPASGGHSIDAMSVTGPSLVGVEQFGINLVSNTSPAVFGSNPQFIPDSSFSSGAAASGYNTANNFRYVDGETIASASASSGQTNYRISYIINAATTTPGGSYTGAQSLICTGTY